jgi:hypothetical protein
MIVVVPSLYRAVVNGHMNVSIPLPSLNHVVGVYHQATVKIVQPSRMLYL